MKTQEELQHEADKQKRSDEINAGLLLEWPDDVTQNSGDGGESLSEWDRNRIQDERDKEEVEWYANERSRAATADYEYQIEEDFNE